MKATDLMIGDWAMIKDYPMKAMPKQMSPEYYTRSLVEIEPIPLTSEILEKNGWKRENDKKAYMVNYDSGQDNMNCWCMWCIKEHNLEVQTQSSELSNYNLCVRRVVIPCDYVHELQHALKTCKIKKEIVL